MSNTNKKKEEKNQFFALQSNQKLMNYRAQKGSLHRSISHFIPINRGRKSGYEIKKNMHKKHGIKLTE